jgi:methyl-accepting chemotaxis protein
MPAMPLIFGYPASPFIVGSIIFVLVCYFFGAFLLPAMLQYRKLGKVIKALEANIAENRRELGKAFLDDVTLQHLWAEYGETLHEQRELNGQTGIFEVTAVRSTLPAEAIFTVQTLVDTPLKTEFFKHLPGILTGLGIIGTFSGLIAGLSAFKVDSDPEKVRSGLNALVGGVHEAFLVSAMAIGCAMVATFIEKIFVTALYKRVELICQLLDGGYQSGAGEEYLSRLVIASEASAKEAKQLKQALVEDLREILEDISERQIATVTATSSQIAKDIVLGMTEGLKDPLDKINNAVTQVSGDQGGAVNKLLAETMTAMTAQIRDLFGSQATDLNRMQQQTVDAMTSAVGKLQQLVSDIGTTGQTTTDAVTEKLEKALDAMAGRQSAMDAQVRDLLTEVQASIGKVSGESNQKLQESLSAVSSSVEGAVQSLQRIMEKASVRDVERGQLMEKNTADTVFSISTEVKTLIEQSATASKQMGDAVTAMQRLTTDSVKTMAEGANRLYAASEKFADAGNATSGVLDKAQKLIVQMADASSALTGSTNMLNGAIQDYKLTRDSFAAMADALKSTVESAKSEASLTSDILSRIQKSSEALLAAENKANDYLSQVSQVLGEAHQVFGTQVVATLEKMNGEFYRHLEQATSALAGAIEDLEGVFEKIPS